MLFKSMLMVNKTRTLLAILAIRALVGRYDPLVQSLVGIVDTATTSFLSTIITSLILLLFVIFVLLECVRFY